MTHTTWKAAHADAQARANEFRRDYGIEKAREYGHTVFRVFGLPRPENRYGHELRCEVVQPRGDA